MRFPVLAIFTLAIVGLLVPTLPAKDDSDVTEIEVQDPELLPGDKAPAFTVEKFLKGDEFTEFEKDKVYVVECWATWCPPCIKSIPHLTELQEKHPEIKVVGISVSNPEFDTVEEFVEAQGDKMAYTVAWEGNSKKPEFSKNWMTPAAAMGIPHAFIVDGKGTIAWMGHPMAMDKPLEAILEGNWDVKKFREEHLATVRLDLEKGAVNERLGQLAKAEDFDGMLALLDKYLAEKPDDFKQMCTIGKARVLSMQPKYSKRLIAFLGEIFGKGNKPEPEIVLNVANIALGEDSADDLISATNKWPKELKAAIRKAVEDEKVMEIHPFANVIAAKAQLVAGDKDEAVATLKKYAATFTGPDDGKKKLQILNMVKDFGG